MPTRYNLFIQAFRSTATFSSDPVVWALQVRSLSPHLSCSSHQKLATAAEDFQKEYVWKDEFEVTYWNVLHLAAIVPLKGCLLLRPRLWQRLQLPRREFYDALVCDEMCSSHHSDQRSHTF